MPRPSKFDDSQILEAAGQLQADNLPVTGYALSVKLGGGRPSSLAERYAELTANVEKPAELPALPSDLAATIDKVAAEVTQRLTSAMTEAHAAIKAQAHVRIDEVEAELAQARKQHASELDDAADHLAAMQERAEVAEEATAAALTEVQTLKEALSKANGELNAAAVNAEKQDKALESSRAETREASAEIARLTAALAAAKAATDEAKKASTEARQEALEAHKQREAAAKDAAANEALVGQLQGTVQRLQQELAALNQEAGKSTAQITQLTDEKARLIERARAQKEAHAAELASLQKKLDEQAQRADAQAKQLAAQTSEIQQLKALSQGSKRG